MTARLLPPTVDNTLRGHRAAAWILLVVALMKLLMGANCMFNARFVATRADRLPLDGYGADAAGTVLAFFAVWGLGQVLLAVQSLVVLARYRALVAAMFLLLLIEHLGRKALFVLWPIVRAPASAGHGLSAGTIVNWGLLLAMVVGLGLALWERPARP